MISAWFQPQRHLLYDVYWPHAHESQQEIGIRGPNWPILRSDTGRKSRACLQCSEIKMPLVITWINLWLTIQHKTDRIKWCLHTLNNTQYRVIKFILFTIEKTNSGLKSMVTESHHIHCQWPGSHKVRICLFKEQGKEVVSREADEIQMEAGNALMSVSSPR